MQADLTSMGSFFSDFQRPTQPTNILSFPDSQREYEWESKHAHQLFEDLLESDENDPHFLGSIVLRSFRDSNKNNIYEMIDGQQRIFTYNLIYSILHDRMLFCIEQDVIKSQFPKNIGVSNPTLNLYDQIKKSVLKLGFTSEKDEYVILYNILTAKISDYQLPDFHESINYRIRMYEYFASKIYDVSKNEFIDIKIIKKPNDPGKSAQQRQINKYSADLAKYSEYKKRTRLKNKSLDVKQILIQEISNYFPNIDQTYLTRNTLLSAYKELIDIYWDYLEKQSVKKDDYAEEIKIIKTILSKMDAANIIKIIVDKDKDAFTIFQTLNNRGKPVANVDLIKNLFLHPVEDRDQRKDIFLKWKDIFNGILKGKNETTFMRYAYMAEHGHIPANALFAKYSDLIETSLSSSKSQSAKKTTIDKQLAKLETLATLFTLFTKTYPSEIYADLHDNGNPQINNVIFLLKSIKSEQWKSIAMSSLYKYKTIKITKNDNVRKLIIKLLERVYKIQFNMIVNGTRGSKIEKDFPNYAKNLFAAKDETNFIKILNQINSELEKRDEYKSFEFFKLTDNLELFDFTSNETAYSIVYLLFYIKGKEGTLKNNSQYTLEHIYPQNPHVDWDVTISKIGGSVDKQLIYSIGNMMFLTKPTNLDAKNYSFDKKKKEIGEAFEDPIKSIQNSKQKLDFASLKDYTKDVIQEREKLIYGWYKNKNSFKGFCN